MKLRRLLLGRKAMTNLDRILKRRGITLPTNIHIVKAMVFSIVMHGCKSWTIKKAEHQRIDAFELWCWRRFLRVPWTARRSRQSILNGKIPWRRKWQPSLVSLPGNSHRQRSLVGCSPWGYKESDTTEWLTLSFFILWKDWWWSSNTLATWCKELTHWKRPWCWEILKAGGEGDDRGWDGWMVSLTQWA